MRGHTATTGVVMCFVLSPLCLFEPRQLEELIEVIDSRTEVDPRRTAGSLSITDVPKVKQRGDGRFIT